MRFPQYARTSLTSSAQDFYLKCLVEASFYRKTKISSQHCRWKACLGKLWFLTHPYGAVQMICLSASRVAYVFAPSACLSGTHQTQLDPIDRAFYGPHLSVFVEQCYGRYCSLLGFLRLLHPTPSNVYVHLRSIFLANESIAPSIAQQDRSSTTPSHWSRRATDSAFFLPHLLPQYLRSTPWLRRRR